MAKPSTTTLLISEVWVSISAQNIISSFFSTLTVNKNIGWLRDNILIVFITIFLIKEGALKFYHLDSLYILYGSYIRYYHDSAKKKKTYKNILPGKLLPCFLFTLWIKIRIARGDDDGDDNEVRWKNNNKLFIYYNLWKFSWFVASVLTKDSEIF